MQTWGLPQMIKVLQIEFKVSDGSVFKCLTMILLLDKCASLEYSDAGDFAANE